MKKSELDWNPSSGELFPILMHASSNLAELVRRPLRVDELIALSKSDKEIADILAGGNWTQVVDRIAAEHWRIFDFEAPPWERLYLPNHHLPSPSSEYLHHKFCPDSSLPADHLANQLMFVSHLFESPKDTVGALAGEFVQNHCCLWLPFLEQVAVDCASPFYFRILAMTRTLLGEICAMASGRLTRVSVPEDLQRTNFMEKSKRGEIGFEELSAFLLNPLASGVYLSLHRLGDLGNALAIGRGFGNREQTLKNLLESARSLDQVPQLLTALTKLIEGDLVFWKEETWDWVREFWVGRLKETLIVLESLAAL